MKQVICIMPGKQTSTHRVTVGTIYTVLDTLNWWEVMGISDETKKFYRLIEMGDTHVYCTGLFADIMECEEATTTEHAFALGTLSETTIKNTF